MKKGYVYAMMAAVAAMTVSGCSSSSSAPASTAAESKTEAAASSESGTTAADTSDVKAAVDTIKFGLVAPLSGDNGAYGTKQEKGYELAMEEINAAGGVLGAKLELETYDDGGDASTAANGAQKFADGNRRFLPYLLYSSHASYYRGCRDASVGSKLQCKIFNRHQ